VAAYIGHVLVDVCLSHSLGVDYCRTVHYHSNPDKHTFNSNNKLHLILLLRDTICLFSGCQCSIN